MSKDRQKGPRGRRGESSSNRGSDGRGGAQGHGGQFRDDRRPRPPGAFERKAADDRRRPQTEQRRDHGRRDGSGARPPRDANLIWGFHSVREALRAGRRKLSRLHATPAAAEKLAAEIAAAGVPVAVTANEDIDAMLPDGAVHQGVLLEAGPLPDVDIDDLPAEGIVLVLDQVTDPHNVGAIVRTAAAFGVHAIVTTERHSPALGGVLAKAASGGLEHVDIVTVVNLARALETLGEIGFQRVGLDSDGPLSLADTPVSRPLALVLGAEGKGLRRLSREKCDSLARIDLPGAVRSLNVSNACAVALTIATMRLAAS